MAEHRPSDPLGDPPETDTEAERSSDRDDPDATHAVVSERGPGAHEETTGADANLRADDTAPGVDPGDDG